MLSCFLQGIVGPIVRMEGSQIQTYLIVLVTKPSKLEIVKISGPTMGNPVEDNAPPFPLRTILSHCSVSTNWLDFVCSPEPTRLGSDKLIASDSAAQNAVE